MRKLLLSVLFGGCSFFAFAQNGITTKKEVITGTLVRVTPPLKDYQKSSDWVDIPVRDLNGIIWNGTKKEQVVPKIYPNASPFTSDPVLQGAKGNTTDAVQAPAPIGVSFDGIPYQPVNPPDPTMAVGPNHIIQMVNGNSGAKYKIYNKSGTALTADLFLDALTGRGGLGDPIVMYDHMADRFVMTEFAKKSENANIEGLIIAVSATADPLGSWYVYFFGTALVLPDYPKFSVWPDAYYATSNDFNNQTSYNGSSVYAFDRALMLAGNPAATMQKITFSTTVFTRYFTMCPVLLQGATLPPTGTGGLFAYMWDDAFSASTVDVDSIGLMEFDVDFATPANSRVNIISSLATAAFKSDICAASRGACISQPSGPAMEALQQRIMNQPVYRKFGGYEGIVLTHIVDKGGNISAPRWYELQKTSANWGIHQQQTYSPDNTHRFLPSIAYDAAGNIAMLYNVSSAATGAFPGVRITGHRTGCDGLNKMGQSETTIIAGTASNGSSRYGDYNHLICDPNGVTFWGTAEYNAVSTWSTRIASFTLDVCNAVSNIEAAGATVTAGNCGGPSVLDPGEVITADFGIINNGAANTTPITATLLVSGGVTNPSGPQNYGVLNAGGPAVVRPFTFKLNGACGAVVTATLQITDGVNTTSVTYTFVLGSSTIAPVFAENFDVVTAPALPAGWTTAQTGATPPALFATTSTTPNSVPNAAFTNGVATVASNSLISPVINVPVAGTKQLTFTQTLNFESSTARFDGAVLEVSLDGGTSYADITAPSIGGSFITGGYTASIISGSSNPLSGRSSWGGVQAAYSTVTVLFPSSFSGANIKFRWLAGWDNSVVNAGINWKIDDVSLIQNLPVCSTCPEIDVLGNGNSIADGDATPSLIDHTDFGTVTVGNNLVRTYTINNTGTANLTISSITKSGADMGMFTIGALTPAGPIAPAGSATFTVTFAPSSAGPKTATITVNNDDADEAVYDFAIQGNGQAAACTLPTVPTLSTSSSTNCGTQSTTLSIQTGSLNGAAYWQWYSGSCGGTPVGTGTSIIVSPTSTTQYFARGEGGCLNPPSLPGEPDRVIAISNCGNITINVNTPQNWFLDADMDGYYTGNAISACSSPGEGYTTNVTGGNDCNDNNTAIHNSNIDINVQGNSVSISDGDATPDLADHTEFGSVNTGGNIIRTFTVQNTGTANLSVSGITMSGAHASQFSVGALTPASPITPGNSATFTVTFTPATTGIKTATVNIANDDCDETNYDFAVMGNGTSLAGCDPVTTRLYVDANAATGGNGSSWACALNELSAAVSMANANMTITSIWVADGTYKPTTGTSRTAVMAITRANLRILGGFAGGEVNATDANPVMNQTIISGDIGVANDMSDNSYRLMSIITSAVNANGILVDGFIFEKGNADAPGDGDQSVGAALYSYLVPAGTPVNIGRSVFRNNYGTAAGAVFLHGTNVNFDRCRFAGNSTNGVAGGIVVYQSSPNFNNCVFAGNSASNAGGAFYGNYGTAVFNKTVFSGNSAGTGGGIYQNRYDAVVNNSVFNANSSISGGGALFVHNASNTRLTNSTLYKNSSAISGGAIVLVEANSRITAENNIFYKNTASGNPMGAGSDISNLTGGANVWSHNILQMNTSVPADNGSTRRNNMRGADPLFINEIYPIGADNMWGTPDDGLGLTNSSPAVNTGDNSAVAGPLDITNRQRNYCNAVDRGAYENQVQCDVLFVDITAAPGGTGDSWANALQELSTAISIANGNMAYKSIWVADGSYKTNTGNSLTAVMAITRADLKILGGFAGGEGSAMAANPAVNQTIISGDIGAANDMSDNSYRLMSIVNLPATPNALVIDGFIFEKGNANAPGDGDQSVGPAIYSHAVPAATPVMIKRCVFRNNYGTATGAIFLHASSPVFDGCRFASNSSNGSGGAMVAYQCSPAFTNCVFAANMVASSGGAFFGNFGTASFTKSVFTGNSAATGGAVYQNRYNANYFNVIFNGNSGTTGGGALFVHNTSVSHAINSTFFKNTTGTSGGAIVLSEANSSIIAENNIFYKNVANGMAMGSGSDITNFTGGANVYANNILQLNTAIPADNGTSIRFNKRGVDPLFTNELSPVGADMMWGTADDGLQLQDCNPPAIANTNAAVVTSCSPAINAGDNAPAIAAGITTDERNNPRIVCSTVDMGAYENQNCGVATGAEQEVISMAKTISTNGVTGIVANPFANELQIRYTGAEKAGITVFGATGKTMWSKTNITEGITRVNSSSWARGMYQVVIVTAIGKRMNYKVVKL